MNGQDRMHWALPPDTILAGRYLLKQTVGCGGFGVTYRAVGLGPGGETVAVKEYFPRAVARRGGRGAVVIDEDAAGEFRRWRENYEREYALLSRLRGNRAILNVRETFRENNTSYLVMDFIPGQTLEARVGQAGPIGADEALSQLRDLLPELAKMHHAGILHRDINPANIMLPPGGMPRLIDFGSARPVPREGGRLTALLRPGYAPPEQYGDRLPQGPWTDVYGLCASLYFALTGVTPQDARQRAVRDELTPLAALCNAPQRLADAVMKGLALEPAARTASFEALWYALFGGEAAPPNDAAAKRAAPSAPRRVPVPEQPAGAAACGDHMAARLAAARRLARRLAPLNAEKYGPVQKRLDALATPGPRTAEDRVALEEAVCRCGKLFAALCALTTRKGD